jgi:hypothetical protein
LIITNRADFTTQEPILRCKKILYNTAPISSHFKKISSTQKPILLFKKISSTQKPISHCKKILQHSTHIFSFQKKPSNTKTNFTVQNISQIIFSNTSNSIFSQYSNTIFFSTRNLYLPFARISSNPNTILHSQKTSASKEFLFPESNIISPQIKSDSNTSILPQLVSSLDSILILEIYINTSDSD